MAAWLLVITTAGRLKWLEAAITSFQIPPEMDVLVIDDGTSPKIGIPAFSKEKGLMLITKHRARGVTDSWNRAYAFFNKKSYEACIISNDDVRLPVSFWRGLCWGIKKGRYDLVVPTSNAPGSGKEQRIQRFLKTRPDRHNIDKIQQALFKKYHGMEKWKRCSNFNGFCFTFGPSMKKFAFSKEFLFNPVHKNRENETDLVKRMRKKGGRIGISTVSYVFHWKYGTYRHLRLKHRDQIWR